MKFPFDNGIPRGNTEREIDSIRHTASVKAAVVGFYEERVKGKRGSDKRKPDENPQPGQGTFRVSCRDGPQTA